MSVYIFSYSGRGLVLAERIKEALESSEDAFISRLTEGDIKLYTVERLAGNGQEAIPHPSAPLYAKAFSEAKALVFAGSCGIAVRVLAPYICSKTSDPAVLACGEDGRFVIPLLSGHIGGANRLACLLAERLGAQAVITTATDSAGRFSPDAWAASKGFHISSMELAKEVSAAILERDLPLLSDLPLKGELPPGTFASSQGELGIYIGVRGRSPFKRTLRLVPKTLRLGLGARRGVSKEDVKEAVLAALKTAGAVPEAIKCAATIDLKAEEAGIREFCEEAGLPLRFYSAEELASLEGDFTASEFVRSVTGVDNVCERAALIGADRLIVRKTALRGVTAALAEEITEVSFE